MSGSIIKGIGSVATLIGIAASFVTDWVSDKKMDAKIEEKVNEAIAKQLKK